MCEGPTKPCEPGARGPGPAFGLWRMWWLLAQLGDSFVRKLLKLDQPVVLPPHRVLTQPGAGQRLQPGSELAPSGGTEMTTSASPRVVLAVPEALLGIWSSDGSGWGGGRTTPIST